MFQRVLAFEPRLRHETPGVGMLFGGGAAAMLGRLLRRTAVGRAPAQAKELDRDPTASERAFRSRGPLLSCAEFGASFY
jgi:hypothetical protein